MILRAFWLPETIQHPMWTLESSAIIRKGRMDYDYQLEVPVLKPVSNMKQYGMTNRSHCL